MKFDKKNKRPNLETLYHYNVKQRYLGPKKQPEGSLDPYYCLTDDIPAVKGFIFATITPSPPPTPK